MKRVTLLVAAAIAVAGIHLTSAAWSYDEIEVENGGTIEGTVVFKGPKPMPRKVIPTKDKEICGGPRDEERIRLGADNQVQDAIVFLKEIEKGKAWPDTEEAPVIDNRDCLFQPRMQVVKRGATLVVKNSDPTLHNTHGYVRLNGRRRTVFNEAMPKKDQEFKTQMRLPGIVDVECDAHGWMQGWMLVTENPYHAITGDDGSFTLTDVPPGDYTLAVFQPYTEVDEFPVTVQAGETAQITAEVAK